MDTIILLVSEVSNLSRDPGTDSVRNPPFRYDSVQKNFNQNIVEMGSL